MSVISQKAAVKTHGCRGNQRIWCLQSGGFPERNGFFFDFLAKADYLKLFKKSADSLFVIDGKTGIRQQFNFSYERNNELSVWKPLLQFAAEVIQYDVGIEKVVQFHSSLIFF